MTRARRPEDWAVDLANARAVEQQVGDLLRADRRLAEVDDRTTRFDELDFRFRYGGMFVTVDVKEKRQSYSKGIRDLWPELPEPEMFVVDETVFRRVVWQGGGGYLLIHDAPSGRWVVFGPWELTLGRKLRYGRWGRRAGPDFLKGKLVVDLRTGRQGPEASVDLILDSIKQSTVWRNRVEPYPVPGVPIREIGR